MFNVVQFLLAGGAGLLIHLSKSVRIVKYAGFRGVRKTPLSPDPHHQTIPLTNRATLGAVTHM